MVHCSILYKCCSAPNIGDSAQIVGFCGKVAAEDRYLWPFCIDIDKRMGQIDDLALPSCLRPQSAAIARYLADQNVLNIEKRTIFEI